MYKPTSEMTDEERIQDIQDYFGHMYGDMSVEINWLIERLREAQAELAQVAREYGD